jgi:hypothetical protein
MEHFDVHGRLEKVWKRFAADTTASTVCEMVIESANSWPQFQTLDFEFRRLTQTPLQLKQAIEVNRPYLCRSPDSATN